MDAGSRPDAASRPSELPAQHGAAQATAPRQTVILGGPGTGKTARVLAAAQEAATAGDRPAYVVAVSPSAAASLQARAGTGFAPRIVTVPALALGVLRETAGPDRRPPRLVGRSERLAMLHEFIAGKDVAAGAPTAADLLARIDRLARHGIDAERIAAWAQALGESPFAARQREFAALALRHDALLRERGLMSSPTAVLAARQALTTTSVRQPIAMLAVDDAQELAPAEIELLIELARASGAPLVVAADDDQSPHAGAAAAAPIRAVLSSDPNTAVVHLERSLRLQTAVARAAEVLVAGASGRLPRPPLGAAPGGHVTLHEADGGHEQAAAVAGRVAASLAAGTRPERIAVACVDPARDARAIALALEARGVTSDAVDLDSDADRPEVRDLLAWFRLLLDPSDAGAVVRALSRPPIALPGSDLARVVRVARRQRVSLVEAARGALDGPGLEPRSRERAHDFLTMVDRFSARLDDGDAGRLVRELVTALGLHRRQLAATGPDARAAVRALQRVEAAAAGHVARAPDASPREVISGVAALLDAGALPEPADGGDEIPPAVRIVGVRVDELRSLDVDELHLVGLDRAGVQLLDHAPPEPLLGEQPSHDLGRARRLLALAVSRARQRVVISASADDRSPLLDELATALDLPVNSTAPAGGDEQALLDAAGMLREQLGADIARAAAGLRDLRLDGDLELTAAVTRVLELVKVAALLGRDDQTPLADAIAAVNRRLASVASPLQRELLESSDLDARLIEGRRLTVAAQNEPSMASFLPRRGEGIGLSATDIATYLACPLQYKFGRVLKIPRPQTVQQRFGIAVHQAIERFHVAGGGHLTKLLGLLDAAWRTGGLGTDEASLQFRARAERALRDYHARLALDPGEPVWVERPFEFQIGRHSLRGRVDRVDRLHDGGYELIDIKTGPPRDAADLQRDVQLALYDVAAREHWRIEPTLRSYYYVLDDVKVQLPAGVDAAWVTDTVERVGAGIEAESFAPTPSPKACGWCDFRLACPAAER